MATEQTITISGTPTVVSGVTVPYVKTSDLEVYVGQDKVEKVVLKAGGEGAGYADATNAALEFSGGGGSSAALTVDVANGQVSLDNAGVPTNKGSGYTTAPNVGFGNISGGTGAAATAEIYVKKTEVTDYTITGTSGSATITFTSALSDDVTKVLVKRATDVTTAINTFNAGSTITATDLNKSFDQIRHRVEELPEVTSTALTNGNKGDITVSGNNWTINTGAVEHGMLAGDCIDGDNIQDDVLNSEHYAAGSIDHEHLANDIIDGDNIQDDVINTEHYTPGSVDYTALGGEAVHMNKIYPESINESKIWGANNPTDGYVLTSNLTAATGDASVADLIWTDVKPTGSILETFTLPCTGTSVQYVARGSHNGTFTTTNVNAAQSVNATNGWVDLNGSSITYQPPTGTKMVVYKFTYWAKGVGENCLWHNALYIGDDEVSKARRSPYVSQDVTGASQHYQHQHHFVWPITIRDTADASIGQLTSWSSPKTIKIQSKGYSDSYAVKFHELTYWDGSGSTDILPPVISITAIK